MTIPRPLKVLYHLHPSLDTLDLTGPLEILSHAVLPSSTPPQKLFANTLTSSSSTSITTTGQSLKITHDIPLSEAYERLSEFDILIIPGGGTDAILQARGDEPRRLIKAFHSLQKKKKEEEGRDLLQGERILMSVCTGSLFLATAGIFSSPGKEEMRVTTHPKYYEKLKEILGDEGEGQVVKDRFVVNRVDEEMGLRVVTCGGVTSGFDGALWLVERVGGRESRDGVEGIIIYEGRDGGLIL